MENPVYSMAATDKSDQCSSSSTAVVCEKEIETDGVTFNYVRLNSWHPKSRHKRLNSTWSLPYCTIAAVVIACSSVIGLVALFATSRELIHAQESRILNQTSKALDQVRTELQDNIMKLKVETTTMPPSPSVGSPGGVYVRWGVNDCPSNSTLIYSGVAASGRTSVAKGGGGNYLCMTSEPEYGMVVAEKQDARSRIYGVEYRNGNGFGDQTDLHGHDVPCAACLTGSGRQAVLMIPGTASCPSGWTKEYHGFIMSSRHNSERTSYICVDRGAESVPGTMVENGEFSLLFPVEGICGTGGGLPCSPYVDGNELQCVVCSN